MTMLDTLPEVEVVVVEEPDYQEPCIRALNAFTQQYLCHEEPHPATWLVLGSCGCMWGLCDTAKELCISEDGKIGCGKHRTFDVHVLSITSLKD